MKKISLLLALVLALCLCLNACGQAERYPEIADLLDAGRYEAAIQEIEKMMPTGESTDPPTAPPTVPPTDAPTDPPTDPEPTIDPALERLYERGFTSAVQNLETYSSGEKYYGLFGINYNDGEITHQFKGNDAAAWIYEAAQELAPWYPEAQEVLDRFTLLEDVLLTQRMWHEDALGNIHEDDTNVLSYRASGEALYIKELNYRYIPQNGYEENGGTPEYTYDDAGNLVRLRYFSGEEILSVIEYTYDDAGLLTQEHYRDKLGLEFNITYTYDENGRVIHAEGGPYDKGFGNSTTSAEYTYDDQGRLDQIIKTLHSDYEHQINQRVLEYDYDENGNVVTIRDYEPWYFNGELQGYQKALVWNYEYDEAGRVIRHEFADHGRFDQNGVSQGTTPPVTYIVEYTYGTFYAYTPAG